MEDMITDGMGSHRSFPYAHYISHMLSRIDDDPGSSPLPQMRLYRQIMTSFPLHKARALPAPRAPVQGPAPLEGPPAASFPRPSEIETAAPETGGATAADTDSGDDSSDDERAPPLPLLSHDHEAGGSRSITTPTTTVSYSCPGCDTYGHRV